SPHSLLPPLHSFPTRRSSDLLTTELKSDVQSFQCVHCRWSPRTRVVLAAAADHHASPVAAANPECALFYRRQNHEAFSLVQQILGNVVWNVENLFENFA